MASSGRLFKGNYFAVGRLPVGTGNEHKCPVCEEYVFETSNSLDICDVCHWQDCGLCASDPDYKGGPNRMTLNEAIDHWHKYKTPLR